MAQLKVDDDDKKTTTTTSLFESDFNVKDFLSKLPKKPNACPFFVVEMQDHTHVVVYEAVLNESGKKIQGVRQYWVSKSNMEDIEDVSMAARQDFFGADLEKQPKDKDGKVVWRMYLKCFRHQTMRPMFLHVKKGFRVVPKLVMKGKDATLEKVYVQKTMKGGLLPSAQLFVEGSFKDDTLQEEIVLTTETLQNLALSFKSLSQK